MSYLCVISLFLYFSCSSNIIVCKLLLHYFMFVSIFSHRILKLQHSFFCSFTLLMSTDGNGSSFNFLIFSGKKFAVAFFLSKMRFIAMILFTKNKRYYKNRCSLATLYLCHTCSIYNMVLNVIVHVNILRTKFVQNPSDLRLNVERQRKRKKRTDE